MIEMFDITLPPRSKETLFLANLDVGEDQLTQVRGLRSHEEIKTLSGRRNRVSVGNPVIWPPRIPASTHLSADINEMLLRYHFYCVRFACSFLPDKDCRFTWAQFS